MAIATILSFLAIVTVSAIVRVHFRRGRVRIERECVLRIRRTVVVIIWIIGILDAVVIVIAVATQGREVRTRARAEETSARRINAKSTLEHPECRFRPRAKETRDESRREKRWIVMRKLLLQLFHIVAAIAVPHVSAEIEAGRWGRRPGASPRVSATRVLCDKLENLRLQSPDLREERLDLSCETAAGAG